MRILIKVFNPFIYKNIANDDDKTLYIINENGDTIFNKKNLNDDYHTVIKENIKIKKNKLIVTTSRIVNGFDVLVNGHFKPVCDLEYDEPINFTYEIDHLKNDAIKISEQNLNNYLKEGQNLSLKKHFLIFCCNDGNSYLYSFKIVY